MERTLKTAGVPQKILDLVPAVIDTCRECRAWASSKADVTPSVELTTQPNEQVEGDILFYKRYVIWHMVDRCDRWHAAEEIPTKEFASILEANAIPPTPDGVEMSMACGLVILARYRRTPALPVRAQGWCWVDFADISHRRRHSCRDAIPAMPHLSPAQVDLHLFVPRGLARPESDAGP